MENATESMVNWSDPSRAEETSTHLLISVDHPLSRLTHLVLHLTSIAFRYAHGPQLVEGGYDLFVSTNKINPVFI